MSYVFGPVPSRRLGQSLGIDPIPSKTCNWNCVYCQLGRTIPLTNERREYFPRKEILAEVGKTLSFHAPGTIDWVTFVGSGETALHSGIGWLIREVKALTEIPVAVISNGSLLFLPEVRQELSAADVVMPSFDAGNAELYRKINRPWPPLTYQRLLDGLISFRKEQATQLWIEVMLIKGLNDSEEALRDLSTALGEIQPDQVHINLPHRPPSEPWVEPPSRIRLLRAMEILGASSHVVHSAEGDFDLSAEDNMAEAITAIITRHPMEEGELIRALENQGSGRVEDALELLAASGKAQVVRRYGRRYWSASSYHYPKQGEKREH
jgi:wyosine [tRNA(Phe)-imidazoG37] synthetase (radical SAM superfamily)